MSPADPRLLAFVQQALAQGATDAFLASFLKSAGWREQEIHNAFREHFEQKTGARVPTRSGSVESARDAFFHLLIFTTLAIWTIALASLLFTLIDRWVPDALMARSYGYGNVRSRVSGEIASILIAFPVFLWTVRSVVRSLEADPDKVHSGVRKWLTYIALLFAACVVIGDLIWVLSAMLGGELTTRFLLKSAVVFVLGSGVLTYFFGWVSTRGRERGGVQRNRAFALASCAIVLSSIGAGLTVSGSPQSQRLMQADRLRTQNLYSLATAVHTHARQNKGQLPQNLADLRSTGAVVVNADPETSEPYEYVPGSESKYQLCAVFSTDSRGDIPAGSVPRFWDHPAGRHCYSLDAAGAHPDYPSY